MTVWTHTSDNLLVANKLSYEKLTNLAETFFQVNVKAAFALEIQTSCPDSHKLKPPKQAMRGKEFLNSSKVAVALDLGQLWRHRQLTASRVLPGSPDSVAKLSLLPSQSFSCCLWRRSSFYWLSLSFQGRSRAVDLFSSVAPPPERDWVSSGRRRACVVKQTVACVRVFGQTLR